jgi:hypothetical protein
MKSFFYSAAIASLFLSFLALADDPQSKVEISEKECRKLIKIQMMNSADYIPGVDAHGRKVKGADLHSTHQMQLPKEITFDLGIDLADKYDLPDGVYAKTNLGKITVKGRNTYWNGKKLDGQDNQAVFQECMKQYHEKP